MLVMPKDLLQCFAQLPPLLNTAVMICLNAISKCSVRNQTHAACLSSVHVCSEMSGVLGTKAEKDRQ